MKVFFISFAVLTLLSLTFLVFDGPGSGMGWPTGIFATLALGTGYYNYRKNGSPWSDKTTS